MKYKLKFEIIVSNRSQKRDVAIQNILGDISTEIESEYPISIPSKDDLIIIGDVEYSIFNISHIIGTDVYTTSIKIEPLSDKRKREWFESESLKSIKSAF